MFQPTAKIIADSINNSGNRLTTFVLTYHRMVHSEFMTHRMLSKNSSSSRAIPVEKMIAKVIDDDVYPLHWGKNQKGMVANDEIEPMRQEQAMDVWESARQQAIGHAKALVALGVHKQVVNRLLEPFSTITVVCTATDYQNFFDQRCHSDAQPEIKALADAMKAEYDASEPFRCSEGAWHLPFVTEEERDLIQDSLYYPEYRNKFIKVATGRCARVSYLNHEGKRDIEADIALHDRLLASNPPHLSPFEHCAMAKEGKYANFNGWQSYRNMVEVSKSLWQCYRNMTKGSFSRPS